MAAFLDQLSKLETDADFKKAAGSHFKGMQTPWHELVAISRWSQKARQALPLVGGHVNAIRDFLSSANPDQIDALLALAIKPEFQKLQGLTTASAFPSSRLQALSIEQRKITTRSEEALRQLEAFGLSPTTSVTAFEQLVNVVSVAQQLKQKLSRPEVVQLLGPDIDARSAVGAQLRPTLEFADQLAKIDVPELARAELMRSSISDGLRQLNHHAAILLERAASARCAQESARSIAKLDGPSFIGTEDFLDIAPDALAARIEFALKHVDALQPYIDFLRLGNRAKATALAPILKAFAESGMDYLRLAEAFEFVFYRSAADAILQDDPRLSSHSGATHEQLRKRFQQLDRKILELRRQQIVQRLMTRYVDPGISRGKASELTGKGLLYRQIGLQKRHIALRELFARAGQAILALKPCLMMSSMSVARFLDPRGLRFDLAVMDEASQIRPEDAIGAIARGAQVVVVGDPMQLPPTSFFEKLDADGAPDDNPDDVGVQDLTGQESILDIAQSAYQPVRQLRWHYRSRHESLIAFSNREFYQDSRFSLASWQRPALRSSTCGSKWDL